MTAPHPKPLALNANWQVARYDSMQWILQRKKGTGWRSVHYCMSRKGLLDSIREIVTGDVDPAAVAEIESWPRIHPGFAGYRGR